MIEHHFNKDLQILEVTYYGETSGEEVLDFSNYIASNRELPRKLKVLTDASAANYNFDHDTVDKLMGNLKKSLSDYYFIMNAFIHAQPKETAYSLMFEIEKNHKNYFHKVFTTKQAALNWLEIDLL